MPRRKLTNDDVPNILQMLNESHPVSFIARQYNVTGDAINRIQRGDTWKHVDGPRRKRSKFSRFYGVTKHKYGWEAYGLLGRKKCYVGVFKTEEEAARAANNFIIEQRLSRPLNVIPYNDGRRSGSRSGKNGLG